MLAFLKKLFMYDKPSDGFEAVREKLAKRHEEVRDGVLSKHYDVFDWMHKNFSMHQLTAGSLGSLLLLSAPNHIALPKPQVLLAASELEKPIDKNIFLTTEVNSVLPKEVRELTPTEEDKIGKILTDKFGFTVAAEINGKRLNRSYGYIGAEQHLARFPGDTIATHFSSSSTGNEDAYRFARSSMAPGLGAYRYFASSSAELTDKENDREKYYIAVQTFLSPNFLSNTKEMYEFFKFRKMLLVNPHNGKAMVVVIGDAGPAPWTGKHLGGSPEVMNYLERFDGAQKGPVLYFFIDDPEDTIPLGPIRVE